MQKAVYKVFSYRGDLSLELWLNKLDKEWYVIANIVADWWKYIVITYTYNDVIEETNKEGPLVEESEGDEDEDEDEEDEE